MMYRRSKIICAAALALIFACALLTAGCRTGFYYENSDKYSVGDVFFHTSEVDGIDVEWLSGDINVVFSNNIESGILVSEDSNKELDEHSTLHYWLDKGVLRIKFAASGKSNYNGLSKNLTVTLPATKTLARLIVHSVSSNVNVSGVRADTLFVNAVSGNLYADGARVYEDATLSTTSGNIEGSVITACNKLALTSTSGSIDFSTEARILELTAETTSGNLRLANLNPAKKASVDTVSGNVELEFLDNAGFSIEFSSVSGDFNTAFATYVSGNKYVCGTPISDFTVSTVSGDVDVTAIPT